MATHGSSSEDDGDDGDDGDSSSDEEVESIVAEYVKKIFKYVKKVSMYGYNVQLREGRHHQHIKFTKIEHKPQKKVVKERRPRQKATIAIVSGQVVENQVLLAHVMNQERTSPPASCKVLHHHYTFALWPKLWKAM
jgi:N-acetylmuramoyl-L-alanine amidase CwlA